MSIPDLTPFLTSSGQIHRQTTRVPVSLPQGVDVAGIQRGVTRGKGKIEGVRGPKVGGRERVLRCAVL